MRYLYIHGFNSGPESRSGRELTALLGVPVYLPRMDYAQPFSICLRQLEAQLESWLGADMEGLCLMGSSLGGFYALSLRRKGIARVVAWNPVVFPALQLAPLVGDNCRFTDGGSWTFSPESLLSYAQAPDPRLWCNGAGRQQGAEGLAAPERGVILGDADELLDPALARVFWGTDGYGIKLKSIHAGHSIPSYEDSLPWLTAPQGCWDGLS